jgi:hypothetical protein
VVIVVIVGFLVSVVVGAESGEKVYESVSATAVVDELMGRHAGLPAKTFRRDTEHLRLLIQSETNSTNSPAKPPALPERIEAVLQLRE